MDGKKDKEGISLPHHTHGGHHRGIEDLIKECKGIEEQECLKGTEAKERQGMEQELFWKQEKKWEGNGNGKETH